MKDIDVLRKLATREVCEKHGCPLELILKDFGAIRYESAARLTDWACIAMEVVGGCNQRVSLKREPLGRCK